ncbi:MAG TPA: antitoxin [Casimicrobiaceae bacterium]|nr:antitoxin [Casimicrobiaceae bacterium]
MSKRLQVLFSDKDLAEIRRTARREGMTTAEWVRQALRTVGRDRPRVASRKKLAVIESAARNAIPAPSVEQMLAEIERVYSGESSRTRYRG